MTLTDNNWFVTKEQFDCHRTSAVDKWSKAVCPRALNFEGVWLRHKIQEKCGSCNLRIESSTPMLRSSEFTFHLYVLQRLMSAAEQLRKV
jgi:hypothetical protein